MIYQHMINKEFFNFEIKFYKNNFVSMNKKMY